MSQYCIHGIKHGNNNINMALGKLGLSYYFKHKESCCRMEKEVEISQTEINRGLKLNVI